MATRAELHRAIEEALLHRERAKAWVAQYEKLDPNSPSGTWTTSKEAVTFWKSAVTEWDDKIERLQRELIDLTPPAKSPEAVN